MDSQMQKQCAQCRRAGTKLFLKGEKCHGPKCALIKRSYPSGQHGMKRKRSKKSVYGRQLSEKQRAKEVYGLRERQFSNYMRKAANKVGETGHFLLNSLESRLDNVVYRMGLAQSRAQARQIVSHGHVLVNDKKVDIPSYSVKVGDVISVKESKSKKNLFSNATEKLSKHEPVSWLSIDPNKLSAKILNEPTVETPSFDVKSIIEFYSRKI